MVPKLHLHEHLCPPPVAQKAPPQTHANLPVHLPPPPNMSEPSTTPPLAHHLALVLHTAVAFGYNEGIGIGMLRSAARGPAGSRTLPAEEHKHGIARGQIRTKNVKTRERAHIYALVLALGLARSTIKRTCPPARFDVHSVTVLCGSPAVVELLAHHQAHGPTSLGSVGSAEDRAMVRRVLASVKRLARCKVRVAVVEDGAEGSAVHAARVMAMAHQRRKKDCRRRRHERRIMAENAAAAGGEGGGGGGDEEDGVGDGEKSRKNGSRSSPTTEGEPSRKSTAYETGEPGLRLYSDIYSLFQCVSSKATT
jgi:hypothetical protein